MSQATIRKALENWQLAVSSWRQTTENAACRESPCEVHRIIASTFYSGTVEDPETFDKICQEVRALCHGCPPHSVQNRAAD